MSASRRHYQKPSIARHTVSLMGKPGRFPGITAMRAIEGMQVADLVQRFGSPLFVGSERIIRDRYRELYRAFSTRYPKFQTAWSYKTNYLAAVCARTTNSGPGPRWSRDSSMNWHAA